MSNREEILRQLSAYLDGELDAADAQSVERALAGDAELAEQFRQIKAARESLRRLPVEHAPDDFAARVLAQAERRHLVNVHPPTRPGINWVRYSVAAAVALIVVSVGFMTFIAIYSAAHIDTTRLSVGESAARSQRREGGGEIADAMAKSTDRYLRDEKKLKGASCNEQKGVAADDDKEISNVVICTDDLAGTGKDLERELQKNSFQHQARRSGDEEIVVEVDMNPAQASRLRQVVSDVRSRNAAAELSREQLNSDKERAVSERPMDKAGGDWGASASKVGKDAGAIALKSRADKPAAESAAAPTGGGGHFESMKRSEDKRGKDELDETKADYYKVSPKTPASAPEGAAGPDKQKKNISTPVAKLSNRQFAAKQSAATTCSVVTEYAQNAQPRATSELESQNKVGQNGTQLSNGWPGASRQAVSQNQSNMFAQRVLITLQYHPAVTQSLNTRRGFGQGNAAAGRNMEQTSQSCPAEEDVIP